ncbi:MAG: GHKL domain-containing protein [Endomicrobium sp.]|jgi:signal transduction histidine kinase|uniref:ATP-binding protein n=1 Tax=Candidatus Endomicrobiellum cubanum TaxID=3242325 RepID=UPI0028223EE6|nr:GHKL domain-containing protein [Endomicrobium sp.]
MATHRLVRWSKDAFNFLQSADDNSIVLDLVISYACATQTGEGFEELVNTINSENIKCKIKKVNITDTSYLYRYSILEFSKYLNPDIPTLWYLKNKDSIDKLQVDTEIKSWAVGLQSDEFKYWNKQIRTDFAGDEKGNGIIEGFKEIVMDTVKTSIAKTGDTFEHCVDFILEECAYTCAHFQNVIMVYPMTLRPIEPIIKRYNLNIRQLAYKMSDYAEKHKNRILSANNMDREIIEFITHRADNVNFFIIDKLGNLLYKNEACKKQVRDMHVRGLGQKTWETTLDVIKSKKQVIIEEKSKEGQRYLSVKAPLMVDGKVEGVIGLAVDITDKKRLEELEILNKLNEERKVIAKRVAHDISGPLSVLELFVLNNKDISDKDRMQIDAVVTRIRNISGSLLKEYNKDSGLELEGSKMSKKYICIDLCLEEIIAEKRCQYNIDSKVTFRYTSPMDKNKIFIKGYYSDFCRMISNLINNGIEAIGSKEGIVDIKLSVKDAKVEVKIRDSGLGMPQEMIDKIMEDKEIGTTKKEGHGIGMGQIKSVLSEIKGEMRIKSKTNFGSNDEVLALPTGTEVTLIFPQSEIPEWIADKIILHKEDIVVVLDDDIIVHETWKERFQEYFEDIKIEYFSQAQDAINYINSKKRGRSFLLVDYELRDQGINGVEVIEECKMQNRSILVTKNIHAVRIKDFDKKSEFLKILPKMYVKNVQILLEERGIKKRIKQILYL